ncbi:MAG: hypothetical protein JST58_16480 [Bacteroidetes bacterium]|nr:hypothetical protein [Bacteroidota bacterium]
MSLFIARKLPIQCLLWLSFIFVSCHSPSSNNNSDAHDSASKQMVVNPVNNIPEFRKEVKPDAVASYKEKTDNPLNDWYFSVSIYETPTTFNYLMKLQFEEIRGEDTLRLPNLGIYPKPMIQKGKNKYSCIIGFMDANNQFREYKLVHVENGNNLKVTTLKHYSLTTAP